MPHAQNRLTKAVPPVTVTFLVRTIPRFAATRCRPRCQQAENCLWSFGEALGEVDIRRSNKRGLDGGFGGALAIVLRPNRWQELTCKLLAIPPPACVVIKVLRNSVPEMWLCGEEVSGR